MRHQNKFIIKRQTQHFIDVHSHWKIKWFLCLDDDDDDVSDDSGIKIPRRKSSDIYTITGFPKKDARFQKKIQSVYFQNIWHHNIHRVAQEFFSGKKKIGVIFGKPCSSQRPFSKTRFNTCREVRTQLTHTLT